MGKFVANAATFEQDYDTRYECQETVNDYTGEYFSLVQPDIVKRLMKKIKAANQ